MTIEFSGLNLIALDRKFIMIYCVRCRSILMISSKGSGCS